ncbi:MAG: hypothetical protein HGA51_09290, partial [Demequinaceae bacterium]|nr:hypothetical protein [Demequinaceae bacterium]
YHGGPIEDYDALPAAQPHLSQNEGTELGVLANSAIFLIIERDGVVVGMVMSGGVNLGWNQVSAAANEAQYFSPLAAPWIHCPGDDMTTTSALEPGTYDVMAITRVFSTPESVALYRELGLANGAWNLDPALLDPEGVYLPDSWDCAQLVAQQAPARGCLPDFKPGAKLDEASGTVTLLYDTGDLVDEFSAVLVSDPVTVVIPGADVLPRSVGGTGDALGVFDSIDDFACGASAGSNTMRQRAGPGVSTSLYEESAGPVVEGGRFNALVSATGFPDGSRVELLPGARLVYLEETMTPDPETDSSIGVQTVVGTAALSAAAPVTTDRFAGPQTVPLTSESMSACPGVDLTAMSGGTAFALVGTWSVVAPDGTTATVDVGDSLWYWGLGG